MNATVVSTSPRPTVRPRGARLGGRVLASLALALMGLGMLTGCQQPTAAPGGYDPAAVGGAPDPFVAAAGGGGVLSAGDSIKVTFAVETNLNTVAKIQLDGAVPLPLVGEVPAAGMTVQSLKTNLQERYQRFLKGDEVTVTLALSSASVYVTGAVLRPGKIVMDRPMTALEAVMEVGGFDIRASPSKVTVMRLENGRQTVHRVDLRSAQTGGDSLPFWLKPFDVIKVPEKSVQF